MAHDLTAELEVNPTLRQVYGDARLAATFALVPTPARAARESGEFKISESMVGDGSLRRGALLVNNGSSLWVNGRRTSRALLRRGDVVRTDSALYVYVQGEPMLEVRRRAALVARSNLAVLILGETGTGKEVLARAIHRISGRPGAFVAVNCAAIPRELLPAELFGHVRGAFSGAVRTRKGWVVTAEHGTLLLDEIGEMAAECQPSLLRLVENHAVAPLGGDRELPVDVRIVAATNRDLDNVEPSVFRSDLYARLAQVVLRVPPLRERQAEILTLARESADELGIRLHFDINAAEVMLRYRWPHNVRELRSVVSALGVFSKGASSVSTKHLREVKPELLMPSSWEMEPENGPRVALPRMIGGSRNVLHDRDMLAERLSRARGNVAELARQLQTSRAHVYRWLYRWGLRTG